MTAARVVAHGLEKRFGPIPGIAGVDLALPPGHALAVLGRNGAGKSTLLRLVAGLLRPTGGTLQVGDGSRLRWRAEVGYVGHATLLYAQLTARENLLFAARLYGVPNPGARADALLRAHGLEAVADRPIAACSRGMAQRVSLARALVHAPRVLVLDEPFTGLDAPAAERLLGELRALREAGTTLLVATHELDRAAQLADAALLLAGGRVAHHLSGPLSRELLEARYAASLREAS